MKLLKWMLFLSLVAALPVHAQQSDDSLPDLPVVNESAPQEPPFTQPNNEFDEAQKVENEATKNAPAEAAPLPEEPADSSQVLAAPSASEEEAPVAAPVNPPGNSKTTKLQKSHEELEREGNPLLQKGLLRVDEDGSYIYQTSTDDGVRMRSPTPEEKKRKKVEKIHHPLAAEGLSRIDKDGSYIYKTKEVKPTGSASLRFGVIDPPNIVSADGNTSYKNMYSSGSQMIVMFNYEWKAFSWMPENLKAQFGLNFFTAQGNGRFIVDKSGNVCTGNNADCVAQEKYTFYAFPLDLGLNYRFQFADHQWIVPFVSAGGSYFALIENRDDSKSFHAVGTPGVYGGGGLMFNISNISRETAFSLSSEYGIANLWMTAEGRYVKSFSNDIDLSSAVVSLGFAADY